MKDTVSDYRRYLKRGKENVISKNELMRIAGFKNERDLRRDIARSREAGQIICSSPARRGGGYYLPKNRQEIEEFVSTLENHAKNTFKAISAAREALKNMEGQVCFDDIFLNDIRQQDE